MNMSVEKKKYPSALPINWPAREEPSRKSQNQLASTGKVDYYYKQTYGFSNTEDSVTLVTANLSLTMRLLFSRSVRNDASLVPPIRQTASIFKQPVTIYKTQEGKVKDIKHGTQEKPKQLFWEKRLEGLRACDSDGYEFDAMDLPKNLKPVGPYITEETLLQSVATALHVSTQPVTGQTGSKTALEKNPGVFLNPDQPLVQAVSIADEDIRRQEDRVAVARKKLQDALRALQT
ncbi:methyl-CpG-binding domain protein 3 isoform X2 [Solenopsis invicta]|uniref:methyl-CpG-binding domain protein 3 isoform X2 n=1 Tax=Solenopsis invicta TaxID=13686 RepID=UPI00059632C2|nr:methyl-CpG-binding domain protein 3 isoform X2 [Solenopsis invicta]